MESNCYRPMKNCHRINTINYICKKSLIFAFIISFLFLSIACKTPVKEDKESVTLQYIEAQIFKLPLTAEFSGRIVPISRSEVRPQVDGIIVKRLFDEGSDVEQGQVLYKIDDALYKAEYDMAKANLAENEAKLTELSKTQTRRQNLLKANAISQQDVDVSVSEHRQAQARVNKAKAELEKARINLEHTNIIAHQGGRIGFSEISPGSLASASQQQPLAIIQDVNHVYVDIQVPSDTIVPIFQSAGSSLINTWGVRLKLNNDALEKNIIGKIISFDISVGENTGNITLRAIFDNQHKFLLPGNYATTVIDYGISENVILLPQKSILSGAGSSHYVVVLRQDNQEYFSVEYRTVEIGLAYNNFFIIKSGIEAGELVAVEGQNKVSSGEIVKGIKKNLNIDLPTYLPQ